MASIAALTPSVAPQSRDHDGPSQCPPTVRRLLEQARQGLLDADYAIYAVDRYALAHRAALRGASAVLAARARPRRAGRPASAWALLAKVAPELAAWSTFFATTSATRAVAEAGAHRLVSDLSADDLVQQARAFVTSASLAATRTSR